MPRIAVCVDGSSPSLQAWKWALKHIIRPSDKVTLMAVAPPFNYAATSPVGRVIPIDVQSMIDANKRATANLEQTLHKFGEEATQPIDYMLVPPNRGVAKDIIDQVQKTPFDQVVVGNRGLDDLARPFMSLFGVGSVSDYVIHHSPCPVTVVKTKEEKST